MKYIPDYPMARQTDPETSHQAAEQHRPKLSERRQQVLDLLKNGPDRTSGELGSMFYTMHRQLGIRTAAETPHKRLPELEKLGLVERSGKRKCRDSGYEAVTWVATAQQLRLV